MNSTSRLSPDVVIATCAIILSALFCMISSLMPNYGPKSVLDSGVALYFRIIDLCLPLVVLLLMALRTVSLSLHVSMV